MYESSDSQFCCTSTRIQSRPGTFDESRLVMTPLTNVGVRGILCTLRLVIEEKVGKEIPESSRLEFLEMFPSNNFVLADANTLWPSKRESIADI